MKWMTSKGPTKLGNRHFTKQIQPPTGERWRPQDAPADGDPTNGSTIDGSKGCQGTASSGMWSNMGGCA